MKIIIETIPASEQRFETLGDYYYEPDGTLQVKITETGNELYNKTIMIHELIEEALTKYQGITEPMIMKHDLFVADEVKLGWYPEDAEPGEHPLSPYKKQHDFAMIVERQIMNFLNIDFATYDKEVMSKI